MEFLILFGFCVLLILGVAWVGRNRTSTADRLEQAARAARLSDRDDPRGMQM